MYVFDIKIILILYLYLKLVLMITNYCKIEFSTIITQENSKSANFRSIKKALEVILKNEQDASIITLIEDVIRRYIETQNPALCKKLPAQPYNYLIKMRSHLKFFKFGFLELTNKVKEYEIFQDSNIVEKLINFQDKLNLNDLAGSYKIQLLVLRKQTNWTTKFIVQWHKRALDMQDKGIELFIKKEEQKKITPGSLKRTIPQKFETQTQTGQEPTKKIKKDSLNYKSIIATMECMINNCEDEKRQMLEEKLSRYLETDNPEHLCIFDNELGRKMFDLRAYIRLFIDAFTSVTQNDVFLQFADNQMIHKIIDCQKYINPSNIFDSYKQLITLKQAQFNWPNEMINDWIAKVIELRKIQIQILKRR